MGNQNSTEKESFPSEKNIQLMGIQKNFFLKSTLETLIVYVAILFPIQYFVNQKSFKPKISTKNS